MRGEEQERHRDRDVGGDVAAHIEPEVRQRGVVARLKLERRLLPARNLHVHLVGCLGVLWSVRSEAEGHG
eukprot:2774988-Rhodomonas_salina.1